MRNPFFIFFLLFSISIIAQEEANTLELSEGQNSPVASLSDVYWIQGHWTGEALGGQVEEIWSPPLGESMMGSFKLVQDGKVKFYEIITISEVGQTLIMRLKHFDPNLKGWEEKDETVDFKLVKLSPGKVFFDGLTFERISENEMNVYVVIEMDGKKEEVTFSYHK